MVEIYKNVQQKLDDCDIQDVRFMYYLNLFVSSITAHQKMSVVSVVPTCKVSVISSKYIMELRIPFELHTK